MRALDQTDRFGGACALVLVDVDHFKAVNDTHGHQAGDKVLQAIAKVMGEQVRTTDSCARIGGEEFCAVLQQTDAAGALELAERLRAKIAALSVRWRDRDIRVTSSFGVATYEAGGGPVKRGQLFDATDRALYRAKGEGGTAVQNRLSVGAGRTPLAAVTAGPRGEVARDSLTVSWPIVLYCGRRGGDWYRLCRWPRGSVPRSSGSW